MNGPIEVPGGSRIADQQRAAFALHETAKK